MSIAAEPWLASYIRAWQRHRIYCRLQPPLRLDADRLPQVSAPGQAETPPPAETPVAVALTGGPLTYRFSYAHQDRDKRGELNSSFLDPGVMQNVLLPAVQALAPQVQMMMLCLAPIYTTEDLPASAFLGKLDRFLAGLPPSCRCAVGIRNPELLLPDYCACLHSHGGAHLFDEALMPLLDQLQTPGVLAAEHVVYRNTPGPWRRPGLDAEGELGMAELVRRCLAEKKSCFLYVDEQTDTVSLETLMNMLNADLAKLSPLRKEAA